MAPLMVFGAALWLSLGAARSGGCEEKATLSFAILTPQDDPFQGVTEVTLTAGEKEKTKTISDPSDLSVSIDMPLSTQVQLELIGKNSNGDVLCSGKTPYFFAVGSSQELSLWVSRVGELSLHPETLETGAGRLATADYINEDWDDVEDDLLYAFWFGGCNASGLPVDTNGYFDPYLQEVNTLPQMSDSDAWSDPLEPVVPRCGSVAMGIGAGMFLVFGGTNDAGQPTDEMDFVLSQGGSYRYFPLTMECGDGVDNDGDGATDTADDDCVDGRDATEGPGKDWARSGAQIVSLGPYNGLFDANGYSVVNSFLIAGGLTGSQTAAATALYVTASLGGSSTDYVFDVEPVELLEPRGLSHTATLTVSSEDDVEVRTVLLFGGTQDASGVAVAESLRFQIDWTAPDANFIWSQRGYTEDTDGVALPALTGHAAVTLSDGTILVAGGKTSDGTRLADAWLFDPATNSIQHLPEFLGEPRAGHTMTRSGSRVLVAGGEDETGELATHALVITADRLNGQLETTSQTPMKVPRWGHAAVLLGNAQIAILGGFDASNTALKSIEIYNPHP